MRFSLLPLLPVVAAFSLGCSAISPPPLLPQLAGPMPSAPGDMRILLMLGLSGGVWVESAVGAELRVESQVNEWGLVGGGVAVGRNLEQKVDPKNPDALPENGHPRWLYAARAFGRANPGSLGWLSLGGGVGITGTNMGLVGLTLDTNTILGHAFEVRSAPTDLPWRVSLYGGPAAALSIPLRQGHPIMRQKFLLGLGPDMRTSSYREPVPYATTFYFGMQTGVALDAPRVPGYSGALELLWLAATSQNDGGVVFAIATGQGARLKR